MSPLALTWKVEPAASESMVHFVRILPSTFPEESPRTNALCLMMATTESSRPLPSSPLHLIATIVTPGLKDSGLNRLTWVIVGCTPPSVSAPLRGP